ncbi:MAG: phosphoglycerate dehydrogenase [Nitrospinota bacterium]
MPRIVVPDDFPSVLAGSRAEARLRALGEVEVHTTRAESAEELLRRVQGAEAIVNIRAHSRFDREFFSRARGLRHLSIWGTGTDNVDLPAARAAGVTVTHTPGVAAASVAEHAIALMLAVARRIPLHDAAVRRGEWPRGSMVQLRGKTLGLVGLGAVGRETARLAKGLGMKLLAWTFHPDPAFAAEVGLEWAELDALYARADALSLHLRLSPETRGMVGQAAFARLKPGAILVNTARGPIVEEGALLGALASGRFAGAGLDVFEAEPLPADHPLTKLPQVVLSPHNAGITPEVTEAGLLLAAENVAAFLAGRPRHVVN